MTNVLKAVLIINAAKKGWSEGARKKAAATRRRKKSNRPLIDPKDRFLDPNFLIEDGQPKDRKMRTGYFNTNAAKKGWTEEARKKAAMTYGKKKKKP